MQVFLLASSSLEPGLLQAAESFAEGRPRHGLDPFVFTVLDPPASFLRAERRANAEGWISRWTPAADGCWLTRDSELVLAELANALGTNWQALPQLIITQHLGVEGQALLAAPTGAELFVRQLTTLRQLAAGATTDLAAVAVAFDSLDGQAGRPCTKTQADLPRLDDLLQTVDLGLQAWWAERARRELGRPWRDTFESELRERLECCRGSYLERVASYLTAARQQLAAGKNGSSVSSEAALLSCAERLGPLALVGELLCDLRPVRLPRGLDATSRRLLETALRVGSLLALADRKELGSLDVGVAAVGAWKALERTLNHGWFGLLSLRCTLDTALEQLADNEHALAKLLGEHGLERPRSEHVAALTRVIVRRRAYLAGETLTIDELRRLYSDLLDSGVLASLRPARELVARSARSGELGAR